MKTDITEITYRNGPLKGTASLAHPLHLELPCAVPIYVPLKGNGGGEGNQERLEQYLYFLQFLDDRVEGRYILPAEET